jgi:hypothetical protein
MPARVAAVRVQNQWHARTARLRCVARLTRSLTRDEVTRLARFSEFLAAGDVITYTCRPEEVEETEQRLAAILAQIHSPSPLRLAEEPRATGADQ